MTGYRPWRGHCVDVLLCCYLFGGISLFKGLVIEFLFEDMGDRVWAVFRGGPGSASTVNWSTCNATDLSNDYECWNLTVVDGCSSNPCLGGAICAPLTTADEDGLLFSCQCPPGVSHTHVSRRETVPAQIICVSLWYRKKAGSVRAMTRFATCLWPPDFVRLLACRLSPASLTAPLFLRATVCSTTTTHEFRANSYLTIPPTRPVRWAVHI